MRFQGWWLPTCSTLEEASERRVGWRWRQKRWRRSGGGKGATGAGGGDLLCVLEGCGGVGLKKVVVGGKGGEGHWSRNEDGSSGGARRRGRKETASSVR